MMAAIAAQADSVSDVPRVARIRPGKATRAGARHRWLAAAAASGLVLSGLGVWRMANSGTSGETAATVTATTQGEPAPAPTQAAAGGVEAADTAELATPTPEQPARPVPQLQATTVVSHVRQVLSQGPQQRLKTATCLAGLGTPDAQEYVSFEGMPALLLVFPTDTDIDIWVVSPDCKAGAPGVQFHTTVPR